MPVASSRSLGTKIDFKGQEIPVISVEEAVQRQPDIALFSAGGDVSKQWARAFTNRGTTVIDNSSAWRMDPSVPLIVPEVNGEAAGNHLLIANPNCSTIQLVMALKPLHDRFLIRRAIVSTYQSVTGTGQAGHLGVERVGDPYCTVNQQINKSTKQLINKSTNQQINKSTNRQHNKSTNHHVNKSTNQQIKSTNQQINKSTNQ